MSLDEIVQFFIQSPNLGVDATFNVFLLGKHKVEVLAHFLNLLQCGPAHGLHFFLDALKFGLKPVDFSQRILNNRDHFFEVSLEVMRCIALAFPTHWIQLVKLGPIFNAIFRLHLQLVESDNHFLKVILHRSHAVADAIYLLSQRLVQIIQVSPKIIFNLTHLLVLLGLHIQRAIIHALQVQAVSQNAGSHFILNHVVQVHFILKHGPNLLDYHSQVGINFMNVVTIDLLERSCAWDCALGLLNQIIQLL